jgi:hypothetical protein
MTMKTVAILGIAFILGVVAFTYQGTTYITREKVIDLGPLQATVVTTQTLPLPSLVGGVALVAGMAWLIIGARQRSARRRCVRIKGSVSLHRVL